MYCGYPRLCVCLSAAIRPHYCTVPDVTWGRLPPSCALLGRFAIGAPVALLWQHNANPSYKLASIPRYNDIVRTASWAGSARVAGRSLAGDGGRSQNCAPYMGSGRGWLAGDWPSTGSVLNLSLIHISEPTRPY